MVNLTLGKMTRLVLFSRAHHVLRLTKENETPRWPPKKIETVGDY